MFEGSQIASDIIQSQIHCGQLEGVGDEQSWKLM